MTLQRVVAATDFSEPSARAVAVAIRWAQRLTLPLTVAHVFDPAPLGPSAALPIPAWPTVSAVKALERAARAELDETVAEQLQGVAHDAVLHAHPNAALGICDLAQPNDLVVMGTHGRTGMKRMLMGSVAEQVTRHAPCAVLTVRGDFDLETLPRRVVVCSDFSEAATAALERAGELSTRFAVEATSLVHAKKEHDWRLATAQATKEQHAEIAQSLRDSLERLHGTYLTGPMRTTFIVTADVSEGLAAHAVAEHADLLVLATHGRTGVARLVIGSVAEGVARHAHCPVLVARSARQQD